ncbi:MAG TPA: tetratricopeptide repeat protein, partial [Polyangia bacterium]
MRRITVVAGLACALGAPLAFPSLAHADEIDNLGGKVIELDQKISDLDAKLKPPMPPGPEIADRRLIDAQVLYELKNYEAASIILFDVVDKYPNSPAYPEALYYLADSLFLKRDYLSSRRFFEKIVEQGPANPRYQESLQRLIDLALHTSDYSPVDGYIEKLNAMPAAKQLPSVPYVEGKYFFFRQQYDKALATLKQIGPDHIYYFHALYFVGAANVGMGGEHLADAIQAFATILKTPAKTDSQKRITELA